MSMFYGVRVPDVLSEKIVATGKGKTEVITAALESYFSLDAVGTSGAKVTVETVKPTRKKKLVAIVAPDPITVALELAASGAEESAVGPAIISGCGKHPGGPGWAKSGGWWCVQCGKIV